MRAWVIAGTVLLAACTKKEPKPVDAGVDAAPAASVSVDSGIGPSVFQLPGIPQPPPPKLAPLRVEGYPTPLTVGMDDAAYDFGFLSDGKRYGYCQFDLCCADGYSYCEIMDEQGVHSTLVANPDKTPLPPDSGKSRISDAELRDFPKREGLQKFDMSKKSPPPPTGNILFGDEITFVVREIPPVMNDKVSKSGAVQVGGKLDGEPPVFVTFPPPDKFCSECPYCCFEVQLNHFAVSPSGEEVVFLIYAAASSHVSFVRPNRMRAVSLAALVFNDTGMVHHKKKEWARSAELFTRAVYADPSKELFAYNLACALAEQKDPRAEAALRHAIAVGGPAVKQRALADADFAGVKNEAWFVDATR